MVRVAHLLNCKYNEHTNMSTEEATILKYSDIQAAGETGLPVPSGTVVVNMENEAFQGPTAIALVSDPIPLKLIKKGMVFTHDFKNAVLGAAVVEPSDGSIVSFRRQSCFTEPELDDAHIMSVSRVMTQSLEGMKMLMPQAVLKKDHEPHDKYREKHLVLAFRDLHASLLQCAVEGITEDDKKTVKFRVVAIPSEEFKPELCQALCDCSHPPTEPTKMKDIASLRCKGCEDPTFPPTLNPSEKTIM